MGLFCFALPSTPPRVARPKRVTVRDVLNLDALSLMKDRSFAIFVLGSLLICIPLAVLLRLHEPLPERERGRKRGRQA